MKKIGLGMVLAMGLAVTSVGCATAFTGSAYVKDGRAGCEAKCDAQGLEFAGMVYMGEYSDACVCAEPGQVASAEQLFAASATGGGAVGVVLQRRQQQQQQNQSNYW